MRGHNRSGVDKSGRLSTRNEKRDPLHRQAGARASLVLPMSGGIWTHKTRLTSLLSIINQKERKLCKTQTWTAISVYVLVAIIKKRLFIDISLYTILQIPIAKANRAFLISKADPA